MLSAPSSADPHIAHPAHALFPTLGSAEVRRHIARARATPNEVSRQIREHISQRKLQRARKDGL